MAARAKEFKVPLPLALKIDKFVEILHRWIVWLETWNFERIL